MSEAGSCNGSQGSTASVREDPSIVSVSAEHTSASGDQEALTTVVIATSDNKQTNGGIDNLAFQAEVGGGDSTDSAPPAEAVNLELVNMTPFGEEKIPAKNGKEEALPEAYNSDPYDEYFVPVNEHRKYIRGEKLYVTKDKRQAHKWKRTVCWGVALTLLAAAVLIAVLAATGVILSQEDDKAALQLASGGASNGAMTTAPPVISKTQPPTTKPPASDTSQPYVPRALEAQMTIEDRQFEEALTNPNSSQYRELARTLEEELKTALFDHQTLNYGPADISIKVIEFLPGSVVVRYRVAWNFKPGMEKSAQVDPVTEDDLRQRMTNYLGNNGGYLYVYRIATPSLSSQRILDPCQSNNGGCSHLCGFDYNNTLRAVCSCPDDLRLAPDHTTCIDAQLEVSAAAPGPVEGARHFPDDLGFVSHHVPSSETSSTTAEPHDDDHHEHDHHEHDHHDHDHHDHDHHDHNHGAAPEPSAEPEPEPSSEPEPESDKNHHSGAPEPEPSSEPTSDEHDVPSAEMKDHETSSPEPAPEPESDHDHSSHPEPSSEHENSSPEPEPSSEGDHIHSVLAGTTKHEEDESQEVKSEPEPSSEPEPASDKEDEHHNHIKSEASPEPEPETDKSEESKSEPEPSSDKEHEHSVITDVTSEKEDISAETKAEPEPQDNESKPEPEPTDDNHHKSSEGKAEPEPATDKDHESVVPEPSKEETSPEPDTSKEEASPEPEPSGDKEHEHSIILEPSKEEASPEPSSSKEEESMNHKDHSVIFEPSSSKEESSPEPEPTDDKATKSGEKKEYEDIISTSAKIDSDEFSMMESPDIQDFHDINNEDILMSAHQFSSVKPEHEEMEGPVVMEVKPKPSVENELGREHRAEILEIPGVHLSHVDQESTTHMQMVHMDHENTSQQVEVVHLVPLTNPAEETLDPDNMDIFNIGSIVEHPVLRENVTETIPMHEDHIITEDIPTSPAPSTTHHTPSKEHEPTSEPDDYDANNDLLAPHEHKTQLKSSRFENSYEHNETDNQELNDIFLEDKKPTGEHLNLNPSTEDSVREVSTHEENKEVKKHDKKTYIKDKVLEKDSEEHKKADRLGFALDVGEDTTPVAISTQVPEGGEGVIDVRLLGDHDTTTQVVQDTTKISQNLDIKPLEETTEVMANTEESVTEVKPEEKSIEQIDTKLENEINDEKTIETTTDVKSLEETTEVKPEEVPEVKTEKVEMKSEEVEAKTEKQMDSEAKSDSEEKATEMTPTEEKPLEMIVKPLEAGVKPEEEGEMTTEVKPVEDTTEIKLMDKESEENSSEMKSMDKSSETSEEKSMESKSSEESSEVNDETKASVEQMTTEAALDKAMNELRADIVTERMDENIPDMEATATEEVDTETVLKLDHEQPDSEHNSEVTSSAPELSSTEPSKEPSTTSIEPSKEPSTTSTQMSKEPSTTTTEMSKEPLTTSTETSKEPSSTEVSSTSESSRAPAPVFEEPSPPQPASTQDPANMPFSKCTAGQFQCVNGTSHTGPCVSLSAKCDSVNDCSDASDELGCIEDGCPGNFQCSNGQCLKRHLVCNGIVDCNDSSDEADCGHWQCKFDELKCPSGRCIPLLWQCDGKADCENHTDEQNCQASCGNQEYMCPERWCIPLAWRCNGRQDCAQGDDEKLCDCSVDEFRCSAGGCVSKSQVCDGEPQCPDLSDEWGCLRINNDTLTLQVRSPSDEWLPVCADNWDNTWSNAACQELGYSEAVFTEFPALEDDSARLAFLKPSAANASSSALLGALERSSRGACTSSKAVEVSCQDFTCGHPQGAGVGVEARLVGGSQATAGQWPSVALMYNNKHNGGCTASVVSPVWLIVSLSCLSSKDRSLQAEQWQVYAGGSVFVPGHDDHGMQVRQVRSIISQPQARFNRLLMEQDAALIRLKRPLALGGPSVGAICLASRSIAPRQLCVTAGWGYNTRNSRDGSVSQYLHYLPVPTIGLKECNSSRHYNGLITADHICAGYTDAERSPCDNDEGAPLMCINEEANVWELHGLLSHHSHCGRGFHPSIFTSVPALRSWVDHTLGSHLPAAAATSHNLR